MDVTERIMRAWKTHVPGVTAEEVAALLPIVEQGRGRLNALVLAFRAGRTAEREQFAANTARAHGRVDTP